MHADQSCKECRRRKVQCDRTLPACGLCDRYRRHCLYEKHERTPLTRRHLTDVEERLERAEALIRTLRRQSSEPGRIADGVDMLLQASAQAVPTPVARPVLSCPPPPSSLPESPPRFGFEWDEQDVYCPDRHPMRADTSALDSPVESDGMSSLTVRETETGYVGVASGAALLRILEPRDRTSSGSPQSASASRRPAIRDPFVLLPQPDIHRHVADTMVDAYFATYHVSYPVLHEPAFRAQLAEVVPRPHGRCWAALAYTVAALGVFATATYANDDADPDLDLRLFAHARALLSFDLLEVGSLGLVQTLALMANFQQKRDKPNAGHCYLGLAVRMATGLGLHKEFPGWVIAPLALEMRRRVWWVLYVFDVGATITFSRPLVWPRDGVEAALPRNVLDRDLTAASTVLPAPRAALTPYTAAIAQARFHVATSPIYGRVISKPLPSATELLRLDAALLQPWAAGLPAYFADADPGAALPPRYALAHAILRWRVRNFRIIMYRPFVIRWALRRSGDDAREEDADTDSGQTADDAVAIRLCLEDARWTIASIADFWAACTARHRLAAWYCQYFLFQAALIPCICLRNRPVATTAAWSAQIIQTLRTVRDLAPVSASAPRCYRIIMELCGTYLQDVPDLPPVLGSPGPAAMPPPDFPQAEPPLDGAEVSYLFPMMWPNATPIEADEVMGDDAWTAFLQGTAPTDE